MAEIRMPINMNQARAAPKGEPRPQNETAIASDHHRCSAACDHSGDAAPEAPRVVNQSSFVSHLTSSASGVVIDVSARQYNTPVNRPGRHETLEQSRSSQRFGRLVSARHTSRLRRSQPQVGGCRQDCDHAPRLSGSHNPVSNDPEPHNLTNCHSQSDRKGNVERDKSEAKSTWPSSASTLCHRGTPS